MELLLQIFLEPVLYAYFALAENILDRNISRQWVKVMLMAACAFITVAAVHLIVIGALWFNAGESPFDGYGMIMLIVGCCVIGLHIVLAIINATVFSEDAKHKRRVRKASQALKNSEE